MLTYSNQNLYTKALKRSSRGRDRKATNTSAYVRPGGEKGRGPPTGKFMRPSGLGQFWGAEVENSWYTGDRWGFKPHFCNLKSRSSENSFKVNKIESRGAKREVHMSDMQLPV